MFGAALLVLSLLLRPMDVWPVVARLHTLEILSAITAIGIGWELSSGKHPLRNSPQLGWLLAFCVWAYMVTVVRLGTSKGLTTSWAMTLGPIFMLLVVYALRRIERLRTVLALMLVSASIISAVGIHQGMQPRQCVELHIDDSDPDGDPDLVPDGRECLGPRICETDGVPGADYLCERIGLFGTSSTQGRIRWRGQLDDPNEVAVIIAALLPFAFMFMSGERRALRVTAVAPFLVLGLWAMVYTQSRGGQLVLATVVVITLVRRYGWWSILLAAAITAPIVLLSWRSDPDAESSSLERAEILSEGLEMLKSRPILGIGVSQFARENPMNMAAHNSYLLIPTEVGLPGYVLWCGLVWLTAKIPIAIARNPPADLDPRIVRFAEALSASIVGMYIGIFFLSFAYKHIFFVWLGLSGALYGAVRAVHPEYEVRTTGRDVGGIFALLVFSLVAVRIVSMTARMGH